MHLHKEITVWHIKYIVNRLQVAFVLWRLRRRGSASQ